MWGVGGVVWSKRGGLVGGCFGWLWGWWGGGKKGAGGWGSGSADGDEETYRLVCVGGHALVVGGRMSRWCCGRVSVVV